MIRSDVELIESLVHPVTLFNSLSPSPKRPLHFRINLVDRFRLHSRVEQSRDEAEEASRSVARRLSEMEHSAEHLLGSGYDRALKTLDQWVEWTGSSTGITLLLHYMMYLHNAQITGPAAYHAAVDAAAKLCQANDELRCTGQSPTYKKLYGEEGYKDGGHMFFVPPELLAAGYKRLRVDCNYFAIPCALDELPADTSGIALTGCSNLRRIFLEDLPQCTDVYIRYRSELSGPLAPHADLLRGRASSAGTMDRMKLRKLVLIGAHDVMHFPALERMASLEKVYIVASGTRYSLPLFRWLRAIHFRLKSLAIFNVNAPEPEQSRDDMVRFRDMTTWFRVSRSIHTLNLGIPNLLQLPTIDDSSGLVLGNVQFAFMPRISGSSANHFLSLIPVGVLKKLSIQSMPLMDNQEDLGLAVRTVSPSLTYFGLFNMETRDLTQVLGSASNLQQLAIEAPAKYAGDESFIYSIPYRVMPRLAEEVVFMVRGTNQPIYLDQASRMARPTGDRPKEEDIVTAASILSPPSPVKTGLQFRDLFELAASGERGGLSVKWASYMNDWMGGRMGIEYEGLMVMPVYSDFDVESVQRAGHETYEYTWRRNPGDRDMEQFFMHPQLEFSVHSLPRTLHRESEEILTSSLHASFILDTVKRETGPYLKWTSVESRPRENVYSANIGLKDHSILGPAGTIALGSISMDRDNRLRLEIYSFVLRMLFGMRYLQLDDEAHRKEQEVAEGTNLTQGAFEAPMLSDAEMRINRSFYSPVRRALEEAAGIAQRHPVQSWSASNAAQRSTLRFLYESDMIGAFFVYICVFQAQRSLISKQVLSDDLNRQIDRLMTRQRVSEGSTSLFDAMQWICSDYPVEASDDVVSPESIQVLEERSNNQPPLELLDDRIKRVSAALDHLSSQLGKAANRDAYLEKVTSLDARNKAEELFTGIDPVDVSYYDDDELYLQIAIMAMIGYISEFDLWADRAVEAGQVDEEVVYEMSVPLTRALRYIEGIKPGMTLTVVDTRIESVNLELNQAAITMSRYMEPSPAQPNQSSMDLSFSGSPPPKRRPRTPGSPQSPARSPDPKKAKLVISPDKKLVFDRPVTPLQVTRRRLAETFEQMDAESETGVIDATLPQSEPEVIDLTSPGSSVKTRLKACASCGHAVTEELMQCGGACGGAVSYCNVECQTRDWQSHAQNCRATPVH